MAARALDNLPPVRPLAPGVPRPPALLFSPCPPLSAPDRSYVGALPEVQILGVGVHAISEAECVRYVLDCIDRGRGGWVVTPNLDHLRRLQYDADFRAHYEQADLRLVDGQLLMWACALQRTPLPGRVAGSDLISSLASGAAERGRSLFLLGGNPGTAEQAAEVLAERYPGLVIAGTACPPHGFESDALALARLARELRACRPDVVFVALGSPKQERVIRYLREELPETWWLGIGVSFSFVVGEIRRAPLWMQACCLEWLHRFLQEPRRLFKRYFLLGVPFALLLLTACGLRGMLPVGRRTSRYGRRRPRALLVDDDPFALDHLELLLTSKFPEVVIEKRMKPIVSGDFDFYFLDDGFEGTSRAPELAAAVCAQGTDAKVFAYSAKLDAATLKRLINSGCDGICEKADPKTWRAVLAQMEARLDELAARHHQETRFFGGVRYAARAIGSLLSSWNAREGSGVSAPLPASRPAFRLLRGTSAAEPALEDPEGLLSLDGVDASRIHREWQLTNTLWALEQRALALTILLVTLPFLALLWLPVRWSSRAPFLFKQRRPGFMGRPFTIYKITTMRAGSDRVKTFERGVSLHDPAVTRIGRFLRETKLDELPQLWNVVRGDMEFVGPRPIAPGLDQLLSEKIPGFNNRYLVKPGLTNIAQLCVLDNALGERAVEDWRTRFEGEEHYIRNKSVSYDLILMAMTFLFVLKKSLRSIGQSPAPVEVARAGAPPDERRTKRAG